MTASATEVCGCAILNFRTLSLPHYALSLLCSKILTAFKYLRRLIHLYLSILEREGKVASQPQASGLFLLTAVSYFPHTPYYFPR